MGPRPSLRLRVCSILPSETTCRFIFYSFVTQTSRSDLFNGLSFVFRLSSLFFVIIIYYLIINRTLPLIPTFSVTFSAFRASRHVGKYRKISLRNSVRCFPRFCGVALCGSKIQMENSSFFVKDMLQLE